jgi:hypothetical protein
MARKGAVRRAGTAIARTAKKLTSKLRPGKRKKAEPVKAKATKRPTAKVKAARATPGTAARTKKRTSDVPLDAMARAYTPTQTSLKTPFRANGADRQRDQDMPGQSWKDEDHYTNKSEDPRIGTHGRVYEPGEKN